MRSRGSRFESVSAGRVPFWVVGVFGFVDFFGGYCRVGLWVEGVYRNSRFSGFELDVL
mgnify:CR=1 FL=1